MHTSLCIICNKEFNCSSSRKYCSDICRRKYRTQQSLMYQKRKNPNKLIGIGSGNHPNNKGRLSKSYKTGKRSYQQYNKGYCEECGSLKNLCVHHIDEDRDNNEETNLKTVCKKCHQKIHQIDLRRDELGRFKNAGE